MRGRRLLCPHGTLTLQTNKSGANSALTPNGKYVVFGGRANPVVPGSKYISLATTATGDVIPKAGSTTSVPEADMNVMMPSFSIDGTKLALVEGGRRLQRQRAARALEPHHLHRLRRHRAQVQPDDPRGRAGQRVPGEQQPARLPCLHPRFAVDRLPHWSVFDRLPSGDCVDTTVDGGDLWISSVSGGAPIRLARIDDPPAVKDRFTQREPTFCPVKRGGFSWVVFTSMRDWGNSLVAPVTNGKRRIWVAAIDEKIGTVDPSHPAFYVEAQLDTANMRGFWALNACIETPKPGMTGPMCKSGFECCSGFCVNNQCADKAKLSCVGVNQTCKSSGECCNQGAVDCIDGVCKVGDVK